MNVKIGAIDQEIYDRRVRDILSSCGDHPASYLALNEETQIFFPEDPALNGMIAYRDKGGCRFTVGGIIAPDYSKQEILQAFLKSSNAAGKKVVFVQCSLEDCNVLAKNNFTVNQLGSSYLSTIANFSLSGSRFVKLRNKISRARRLGVTTNIYGPHSDIPADVVAQLNQIDREWLTQKKAAELAFLIGEKGDLSKPMPDDKYLFVASEAEVVHGYILYSRIFGRYLGWMHDLTRRRDECATGVMELLNERAIEYFSGLGEGYLHYGFTPLADLDAQFEQGFHHSKVFSVIAKWLSVHGSFIYPMETQLQYKKKWFPDTQFPEYIAFQNGFSLTALWQFLRITNII
jgi:lysylphosphatidylglycerol synthetase-like protein (DUF2156 family)